MREGRDEGAGATVRVTLECAGSQLEATVATDWPVASLVPDLLRKVYGQQGAETAGRLSWGLGFPGGQPFPGVSTLADHGVSPGAALRLDQFQQVTPPGPVPTPPGNPVSPSLPGRAPPSPSGLAAGPALANAVQLTYETMPPSRRTRTVLPRQPPLRDRLAAVLGVVFERRRATVEDRPGELEPGVTVSPTRLTVVPRARVSERMRVSWRDSNYGNRLDRAIQGPQLRRCVTIAVMSPKGGVGKTTLTALLGSLFAEPGRHHRRTAGPPAPSVGAGLASPSTPETLADFQDLQPDGAGRYRHRQLVALALSDQGSADR